MLDRELKVMILRMPTELEKRRHQGDPYPRDRRAKTNTQNTHTQKQLIRDDEHNKQARNRFDAMNRRLEETGTN